MIKDKHPAPQPAQPSAPAESLPEEVSANPFVEIYQGMPLSGSMSPVLTLRENPDDEVWFRESSAWKCRDWVKRYVVMPPFTQHSD